jgi:stage III sporulation protein AE
MKKTIIFIVCIFILISGSQPAFASEIDSNLIKENLQMFDLQSIDEIISNGDSIYKKPSIEELITDSVTGKLDLSIENMINTFLKILFSEIYSNSAIMKQLLIIVLLAAILKNLADSFSNKSVGELGFYVTYTVIVMYLLTSFYVAIEIVKDVIINLTSFMQVSMPFMMALMTMTGNVTSSYVFSPIIFFAINFITVLVQIIIAPAIILAASLQIVNYLTEKEILTKFSDLLKDSCTMAIKGLALLFVTILSLQKISAPILNNLALKTAKVGVSAIPVVGSVLNGAVDTVIYFTSAVKSGSLVAIILVIISLCIVPLIKLISIIIILKFIAAVIQPISDERIVKCIDSIAGYTFLLLGCTTIVIVMFVFSVMIMLSF